MPTQPYATQWMEDHHPLPEPLIPNGTPEEVDTAALQAALTAWERSGRVGQGHPPSAAHGSGAG